MTLRARLLLGYGYLAGLVLLATGSAIFSFLGLSSGIDVILSENFHSIRASMRMIEALERLDSATLAALIETEEPPEGVASFVFAFEEALAEAAGNVTEEGESEKLADIESGFEEYLSARQRLVAARPAQPLGAYRREVFPLFAEVKRNVFSVLDINQQAMIRADRRARETAIQSSAWLGVLVTVALLSFVFMTRTLQNQVLSRLAGLRQGMAEISAGDPGRRLYAEGKDELAAIAEEINRLLDRYEKLQAGSRGRLSRERRLTIALARSLAQDAAIFSLSGDCLTGTLGDRNLDGKAAAWVEEEGKRCIEEAESSATASLDGATIAFDLLSSAPEHPVAWLVRVQ